MSGEMTAAEAFTSYCTCPECSVLDLHYLREAGTADRVTVLNNWGADILARRNMVLSDSSQSFERYAQRMALINAEIAEHKRAVAAGNGLDESKFEVIRTCRGCGHDWGQV